MFVASGLLERGSALWVVGSAKTYDAEFGVDESPCVNKLKVVRSAANYVDAVLYGLHVNFESVIVQTSGAKNPNKDGEREWVNGSKFV